MKPVMYIFANKGVGMTAPKLSAQVGHAVHLVVDNAFRNGGTVSYNAYMEGGHYTKIVLEARDEDHLRNIAQYLKDRGFKTFAIIDEGRTEIAPHTFTALGAEIVDKDDPHTAATFSSFRTYKEDPKPTPAKRPNPTKPSRVFGRPWR